MYPIVTPIATLHSAAHRGARPRNPGPLAIASWLARPGVSYIGLAGKGGVAAADRGDAALGLLPVLLAAEGGQVEQVTSKS